MLAEAQRTVRRSRFHLPIETEADLALYIERAHGLRIPDVQVCPNHSTPWRAFCDAYFGRNPACVWKASRGFGGKSVLLALLSTVEASTLNADVTLLGGSGQQSQRVHEAMGRFWAYDSAPRYLMAGDPTGFETRFRRGATIRALLASTRSARGPHPQRLRMDEVDEMDLEILDAALGQPMSRDGVRAQTVMSSTHQYTSGTMTEILKRADEKGWPVHEWCYRETLAPHGWLPTAEVEEKKTVVSTEMWDTEYELQRPSGHGLVFPSFSRSGHVKSTPIDKGLEVVLGWDFGFRTTGVIAAQPSVTSPDERRLLRCFWDAEYRDRTTRQACIEVLEQPWAERISLIACDPAGDAAASEMVLMNDYQTLKAAFPGARVVYSTVPKHRSPRNRADYIRQLLRSADGKIGLQLDPSCKGMIRSIADSSYPKTSASAGEKEVPLKDGVNDHLRDALGYLVVALYHHEPATVSRRPW